MEKITNLVVENSSSCPTLDLKTRIVGFVITFLLGIIILFMSFGALGGLFLGQTTWFAILYTSGNITVICA